MLFLERQNPPNYGSLRHHSRTSLTLLQSLLLIVSISAVATTGVDFWTPIADGRSPSGKNNTGRATALRNWKLLHYGAHSFLG